MDIHQEAALPYDVQAIQALVGRRKVEETLTQEKPAVKQLEREIDELYEQLQKGGL